MDSNDNQFLLKQMEAKDLKGGLNCFTAHHLEESLSTLEAFYECDPKAFYVALNKTDNGIIGVCGSPVTTHNSGFLGLYGVDKEFQNKGIGKKLFNKCVEHIGHRNCGLHAVPEKLDMYRNKAGFKVIEGVSMVVGFGVPQNVDNLLKTIDKIKIESFDQKNEEILSKIIEYDSKVHKESRKQLLELTLNKSDYNTFVAIDESSDNIIGFGCIRPDNSGNTMIGPVYADNDLIAEVLVYNLIKSKYTAQTHGIHFMTISTSLGGIRIAQKLQIKESARCERVFTKEVIPVNHKYIYCIHSPNFSL